MILLEVKNLCKYFPVYSKGLISRHVRDVKAVDDVSFCLHKGETLGLVGESGCGKTTVARTVLRAYKPTSGEIRLYDTEGNFLDLAKLSEKELRPERVRMQMVFQDPYSSLNPRFTVEEIIGEPLQVHYKFTRNECCERIVQMLERVGLSAEHLQRYAHDFSGGQRQRIGIARALILNPSLVVADEAVSALDVSVQAQVINLLNELQSEFGLTYIFVSHDLSVIRHVSTNVLVMYAGRMVEYSKVSNIFQSPLHPYTQALLSAVPLPDPDNRMTFKLLGDPADPAKLPTGCPFHPRCHKVMPICKEVCPCALRVGDSEVACHLYNAK